MRLDSLVWLILSPVLKGFCQQVQTQEALKPPSNDKPAAKIVRLREKAIAGNPQAQYLLGMEYIEGADTARDYREAFKWEQAAVEQGFAELDYISAYVWYRAGEAGGDRRAQSRLKALLQLMLPKQIVEAETRSRSSLPHMTADRENRRSEEERRTSLFTRQ